jgi:hypothetical protein
MADILLSDLQHIISELGCDGGLMSPSIYDTAQVLRLAPPDDAGPALEWLLTQQQVDGGWGTAIHSHARDLPTLAAILALEAYPETPRRQVAIQAGLAFLRRQAAIWVGPLPNDLPVGLELLLPYLLEEAAKLSLHIPLSHYQPLVDLGRQRRRQIAALPMQPATTPVHSWEALGTEANPALLDTAGSIGHSPSATAAWLHRAHADEHLDQARTIAKRYLQQASAATGVGISGVVPTVWPIAPFEQIWSLYALQLGGLLHNPILRRSVQQQVDALARKLSPEGIGMSDYFTPDGDCTAVAIAILAHAGRRFDTDALSRFADLDSGAYYTYIGEMNRSLSATAHAAHTLQLIGKSPTAALNYLMERQSPLKQWTGDKWHASWLYLTGHTVHALIDAGRHNDALTALPVLLEHQHANGGWGVTTSSGEETAHATLALLAYEQAGILPKHGHHALAQAQQWLFSAYKPFVESSNSCWIGKEVYCPRRVAQAFQTTATLACALRIQPSLPNHRRLAAPRRVLYSHAKLYRTPLR